MYYCFRPPEASQTWVVRDHVVGGAVSARFDLLQKAVRPIIVGRRRARPVRGRNSWRWPKLCAQRKDRIPGAHPLSVLTRSQQFVIEDLQCR